MHQHAREQRVGRLTPAAHAHAHAGQQQRWPTVSSRQGHQQAQEGVRQGQQLLAVAGPAGVCPRVAMGVQVTSQQEGPAASSIVLGGVMLPMPLLNFRWAVVRHQAQGQGHMLLPHQEQCVLSSVRAPAAVTSSSCSQALVGRSGEQAHRRRRSVMMPPAASTTTTNTNSRGRMRQKRVGLGVVRVMVKIGDVGLPVWLPHVWAPLAAAAPPAWSPPHQPPASSCLVRRKRLRARRSQT